MQSVGSLYAISMQSACSLYEICMFSVYNQCACARICAASAFEPRPHSNRALMLQKWNSRTISTDQSKSHAMSAGPRYFSEDLRGQNLRPAADRSAGKPSDSWPRECGFKTQSAQSSGTCFFWGFVRVRLVERHPYAVCTQSVCSVCMQSVCSLYVICICNLYTVCMQSVCNLYAVCRQSVGNLYAVCMQSVCSLYAICMQSVCTLKESVCSL